jgi:hypothetical protein
MASERTAEQDLLDELQSDEVIEGIVFGAWGWGYAPEDDQQWQWEEYSEPFPPPVPFEKRGIVLTWEEARPYMQSWRFNGGYGSPECYAVRVWTNRRVYWITQYDGATGFSCAPRSPENHIPNMPGR